MKKLLIVEDNLNLANLLVKSLCGDFEVLQCRSAEDAYHLLQANDFFAALVDVNLPGMNGLEFINEVESRDDNNRIFLIVMSADSSFNSKLMATSLGAISFIEKPFDIRYVRGILKNLVKYKCREDINYVEFGPFRFDDDFVFIDEVEVQLTRAERNILYELVKNVGGDVARDRLFQVCGNHKSDVDYRIIDKHISSIRKKIKLSGVKISAVYGCGYTIKKLHKG